MQSTGTSGLRGPLPCSQWVPWVGCGGRVWAYRVANGGVRQGVGAGLAGHMVEGEEKMVAVAQCRRQHHLHLLIELRAPVEWTGVLGTALTPQPWLSPLASPPPIIIFTTIAPPSNPASAPPPSQFTTFTEIALTSNPSLAHPLPAQITIFTQVLTQQSTLLPGHITIFTRISPLPIPVWHTPKHTHYCIYQNTSTAKPGFMPSLPTKLP